MSIRYFACFYLPQHEHGYWTLGGQEFKILMMISVPLNQTQVILLAGSSNLAPKSTAMSRAVKVMFVPEKRSLTRAHIETTLAQKCK